MTTSKLTPTQAKYANIIASGEISESEIISMKSFMGKSKENAEFIFDLLNELPDGLTLSHTQNQKGIDFLLNQWKTPRGIERKNNPFGYREQHVLENFSHFTIDSFYDCSNYSQISFYLPIYHCISKDGSSFEYYYNGTVNIIG